MLIEADARGLPGVRIERVGLQRASAGFPLDDVIVHARGAGGVPVTLEIQVKRTVTFAPGDTVFADVVSQIAAAIDKGALADPEHRFAVAIARRSAKIDGAYQDLLTWARQLSRTDFFARVANPGEGNEDMRRFVATFREQLGDTAKPVDDERLWTVLRRFQILPFDFGITGSADHALSVERTTRALDPGSPGNATTLWEWLGTQALDNAAAGGGEINGKDLVDAIASGRQFLLAGRRDFRAASAALAEMTRHALADIDRDIAGVVLPRHGIIKAVHSALDIGRYVEVRGGAGVGKSAVLRHFVEQIEPESRVILLTPNRTVGPGWAVLKDTLHVPGTAREFLSDLAAQGGGILLVDSLDFFSGASGRATVVDLVREAAGIRGFRVIVTARREFGVEEPSWLPANAITQLGAAPPVLVEDLDEAEIEALREGAPQLKTLLADGHPAKAIVRNPYRLARLAALPDHGRGFRSEVGMAEEWWRTGDGPPTGRRERRRVLADLADAALDGKGSIDAREHDSAAIDALIARETVVEIATDQLAFRHDVLREWAGAARLHERNSLENLPIDQPLPSAFSRTMDLAARFALERSGDSQPWSNLLGFLDAGAAHVSWRRPAILALVRSEISGELLERAKDALLVQDGELLREAIHTTLAVESQDGRALLAQAGMDVSVLGGPFFVPSNASWGRLVAFALRNSRILPARALDDVLTLFERFSVATLGATSYTKAIVARVYDWLSIVESERGAPFASSREPGLTTDLTWSQLHGFETDLRRILVSFASSDPEIAKAYLQAVSEREHPEEVIKSLMSYRGQLAQAAPKELADLTLRGLISREARDRGLGRSYRDDVVGYLDSSFLPSSPAQGPFLELLIASPDEGLRLVRTLVDHVVVERSGRADPGYNGYWLAFEDGERFFPWVESYGLSRPYSDPYSVVSALMALEVWGHRRIEAGEDVADVLKDMLGPPGSSAAYLLVAVDLILSHWPKTRTAAVPFVACAQLLGNDRQRLAYDMMPKMDLLGRGDIGPDEPKGIVQLSSLTGRVSRQASLENLLGLFALGEKDASFERLRALQAQAIERLGPPGPEDTFASPSLMALHGFNCTNPANYRPVEGGWMFEAPGEEATITARLAAEHSPRARETAVEQALNAALEQGTSPAMAEHAVEYGRAHMDALGAEGGDERWMQGQTVWSAALVAARDGTPELVAEHEAWIREVFGRANAEAEDPVHRMRDGIRFNPLAIASAGIAYLWVRLGRDEDRRTLLELAARSNPAGAHGFAASYQQIAAADARMPAAILRCALKAAIAPAHRYDCTPEQLSAAKATRADRARTAVDAEIAWLAGSSEEPAWTELPPHDRVHRRSIRIGPARDIEDEDEDKDEVPEEAGGWRFDAQAGALWLKSVAAQMAADQAASLAALVLAYADWTVHANGLGLQVDRELSSAPDEWNTRYYPLMPRIAATLGQSASQAFIEQVIALPDRHFYDAAGHLLLAVDDALFNRGVLPLSEAAWVRSAFAARLIDSAGWRRAGIRIDYSVEHHIGTPIAAMMFNHNNFFKAPSCYVLEAGIDRANSFLPIVQTMFGSGPIFMVLLVMLNLFEVKPNAAHAPFLTDLLLKTLARTEGNAVFWVDHGVGRRAVALLNAYIDLDGALVRDQALRGILGSLIRAGVTEAVALEARLAG